MHNKSYLWLLIKWYLLYNITGIRIITKGSWFSKLYLLQKCAVLCELKFKKK